MVKNYLDSFAVHGADDVPRLGGGAPRHVLREGNQNHQVHSHLSLSYSLVKTCQSQSCYYY
jgi:hypothetical protein